MNETGLQKNTGTLNLVFIWTTFGGNHWNQVISVIVNVTCAQVLWSTPRQQAAAAAAVSGLRGVFSWLHVSAPSTDVQLDSEDSGLFKATSQ